MRIVDIKREPEYMSHFLDAQKLAAGGNDALASNYLNIPLAEFLEFNLLLDDSDNVVAFSGIQVKSNWPPDTARIGSRLWINPQFRKKSLFNFKTTDFDGVANKHLTAYQIKRCTELGMLYCFISRQYMFKVNQILFISSVYDKLDIDHVYDIERGYNMIWYKKDAGCPDFSDLGLWQFVIAFPCTLKSYPKIMDHLNNNLQNAPRIVLAAEQKRRLLSERNKV